MKAATVAGSGASSSSRALLCVLLLALVSNLAVVSVIADDQVVLWQFLRENGQYLAGQPLEDDLGPIFINEGDTLSFQWTSYGFAHGLFQLNSEMAFDSCTLDGTELAPRSQGNEYNTTLTVGTYWFTDVQQTNCQNGLKVQVNVLSAGETPSTVVMTTTPVPPSSDVLSEMVVVAWDYNVVKPMVEATTDDVLQFQWSGNIASSLREVSAAAYDACNFASPIQILSEATTANTVNVTGLSVGLHYFISAQPTHCSSAHMRVVVNIIPRLIRFWVTLWPTESATADATDPVSVTITGFDDEMRIWLSEPAVANEASDGSGGSQILPISSSDADTFEVIMRDVGSVVAVRLSAPTTSAFSPLRVRIRPRAEDETRESVTFECSRLEEGDTTDISTAMCIVPSSFDGSSSSTRNITEETSCQCYRQLLAHHPARRVLACSSEGCFASVDDGTAGWSTINGITSLLGTGMDGNIYGLAAYNTTVQSPDGGLTWVPAVAEPNLAVHAIDHSDPAFEENESSPVPLDQHVHTSSDGNVDWGITRKGVVVNLSGTWSYRALWSCTCDGTCGLECDQEP